jgi:hypothetical protein
LFGFRSDKKRKAKIINRFGSTDKPKESLLSIELDDSFKEQSVSAVTQIGKLRFNFIDFNENLITSLSPSSLFAVEIEEHHVTALIASRKGAFLDIRHLKRYSYEELHALYEGVLGEEVTYDIGWLQSFENILVILTHDILHTLPSDVLLIDNRHGDFQKVTIAHSKFNDKEAAHNMLRKQIRHLSGYALDEIYMSSCERVVTKEKKEDESIFAVSIVEKEYYDEIEEYLASSDFRFKRLYSVDALLYASFEAEKVETVLRIHVSGEKAYVLEKYSDRGFEHMAFDLSEEYDSLLLMVYGAHEVVLSGSGSYYESLKEKLSDPDTEAASYGEHKVKIRSFSYANDLPKSIIRTERDVVVDSGDALIVSGAYLTLFGQQFTPDVAGITKQQTLYNYIHKNLKALPFVMLFVIFLLLYGTYLYLGYELKGLKETNSETARMVAKQKKLDKSIQQLQNNIKKSETKIKSLEKLFSSRAESEDAEILHEIAQKLPDDMILTKIEKRFLNPQRGKRKKANEPTTIEVTGKCYQEKSLLTYIKQLKIKEKRVFLVSLEDEEKRVKKMDERRAFHRVMNGMEQKEGSKSEPGPGELHLMKQREIYYSDTLNNTFVLEIR